RFSRDWSSDVCSSDLIYVLSPSRNDKLMGYSMKFKKSFIDKGHHHFDLTYSSSLLQLFATRQGIPIKAELSNNLEELIFKMMERSEEHTSELQSREKL